MKCDKNTMLLYAVTDTSKEGKIDFYKKIETSLQYGITCLQLREKYLDKRQFLIEAEKISELCRFYRVPFIVNDNLDVAIACKADGIHVGQNDISVSEIRKRVGDKMMIGVSVHNIDEALSAVACGADYLGLGAVFPTETKADADIISYETVKSICGSVNIPTVAIGGISRENVMKLKGSGINGIAVVSAIFKAADLGTATSELLQLSKKMVRDD